ncbi:hypothetical protein M0805_002640 [Coniferiporia weirii]|nr:hypothetical protein M0805_002640 [Coniferiporia weirii]
MNSLWYLSMPVGTIFAFRLNELASLSHLRDPEVERKLSLEKTEDEIFMGYVTEVSPSGLEVGFLVSEPQASYVPTSSSAHLSSPRKGIAVNTSGPIPSSTSTSPSLLSSQSSSSSRPRRSTHPAYTTPITPPGRASSRALISSQTPLSALRPRGPSPPPEPAPTAENTSLHPSAPLPWARAYAFRPDIQVRAAPASRRHRFVVGGLTAGGTARAARAQARFFKAEVERAGKAMNRVREEEEEEYFKRIEVAAAAASVTATSAESDSEGLTPEPPSPTSSDTTSGGSSQFSDVPLSSATEHSASKGNNNDGDGLGSDASATTPRARGGGGGGGGLSAPIVIDVMLDIAGVHALPESPATFEAAVARMEKLERASRRAPKERVREWARNAVTLM